jgi:hypothetical protein
MSTILMAILVLAAGLNDAANSAQNDNQPSASTEKTAATQNSEPVFPPRKPAEMRTAVSSALRATATAKDSATQDQAVRQLILILLELEQDQNLTHDERVELHAGVRSRLMSLEQTLRNEATRNQKSSNLQANVPRNQPAVQAIALAAPAAVLSANISNDQQQAAQDNLRVLAQIVGGAAGVNVQQGPIPGAFIPAARAAAGAQPAAAGVGVIGGVAVGGGNAQQLAPDFGPDLVNLIHAVVSPRTWDVNGGPGSVVYYRNLRALVVRAPSEIHEQIGDVLGQMRK